ncbi:MAG: hypothetical protein M9962_13400, partial [Oligoflexia bacterium]|nr:hypothetical protein [Oligoflexia bacterium]
IWIQPAAGDAGGALGAAYVANHLHLKNKRNIKSKDSMRGSYLGPKYENAEVEKRLSSIGAKFHKKSEEEVYEITVDTLKKGQAVGWHQGRMEFGPRALGGRSILGDPRSPKMQSVLNLKVKYRESFRPFAPAVIRERLSEWFELDVDSPYMLLVADVHKSQRKEMTESEKKLFGIEKLNVPRSTIPAVTHVDYSARIQTIHKETNPRFHALLEKFYSETGTPVLVNTSFNVRGEPIVCSPEDSFRCFMGTDIELLVIEDFVMYKHEQPESLRLNYKDAFHLD